MRDERTQRIPTYFCFNGCLATPFPDEGVLVLFDPTTDKDNLEDPEREVGRRDDVFVDIFFSTRWDVD